VKEIETFFGEFMNILFVQMEISNIKIVIIVRDFGFHDFL
jgi:hypothetical protein